MNIYFSEHSENAVFLHFGLGTIGKAIFKELNVTIKHLKIFYIPFNWNSEFPDFSHLFFFLINHSKKYAESYNKLIIIWSSGNNSFASTKVQMDKEIFFFQESIFSIQNMIKILKFKSSRIIFFSSAGGIFEGQVCVSSKSHKLPMNWYGISKLKQEDFLQNVGIFEEVCILRPSSVYSIDNFINRMGLIPTMFINGVFNRTTTIYGNFDTLRDYVLDQDIGKYVAENIFRTHWINFPKNLISGKPYTIFEIKQMVERILGKPLYVSCTITPSNENHITFNPGTLSKDFSTSDLLINLHKLNASTFCSKISQYV